MAFGIGGEYALDCINEENFICAAGEIGIEEKKAMKCFDEMCDLFEASLKEAAYILMQSGFEKSGKIREKILQTGGICRITGKR